MSRKRDAVMMAKARVVASQATCLRKKVGCVIVSADGFDRATGYNGSLPGEAHCNDPDVGCLIRDGHCVRTVHSESNAVAQAAADGVALRGGTVYVTASPCITCFKLLAACGIKRIVYGEFYRDDLIFDLAKTQNIELVDGSKLQPLGLFV